MSLKTKLLGAIFLVISLASVAILFGIHGSKDILTSTTIVRTEAYPILNISHRLTHIIHNTNAAIMSAMDGDEEFETYIKQERDHFRQLFDHGSHEEHNAQKIETILELYEDYITFGIAFGHKELTQGNALNEDIQILANKKLFLTQTITSFRDTNQAIFESSLHSIEKRANRFLTLLLISGAILFLFLMTMAYLINNIIKAISQLEKDAHTLSDGELELEVIQNRNDEIGNLQASFEKMRINLVDHINNLDIKVKERTDEVEQAKREMESILDNIDQGIITFKTNLCINEHHSKEANTIFAMDFKGLLISDILGLKAKEKQQFKKWLELFDRPSRLKRWKKYALLNPIPKLHQIGEKVLELNFQPIIENGELKNIMLLAFDITSRIQAENNAKRFAQEKECQQEIISALVNFNSEEVKSLLDDLIQYQISIKDKTFDDLQVQKNTTFRQAHTLKGWAGTYGIHVIEHSLNHMEELLSSCQMHEEDIDNNEKWQSIVTNLDLSINVFEKCYNMVTKGNIGVTIDEQLLNQLEQEAKHLNPKDKIRKLIDHIQGVSLKTLSHKYEHLVQKSAKQCGKTIQALVLKNENFIIPKELLKTVDRILIHLIRNAIDHGIETNSERIKLGKQHGTISIEARSDLDQMLLSVSDDGKGLDFKNIRKKAIAKNILSHEDPWDEAKAFEMICRPDFSTAHEEHQLSGRGMGMDIIKSEVEALNGELQFASESKKGMTITMILPFAKSQDQ